MKPKMVKAWAFAVHCASGATFVQSSSIGAKKSEASGLKTAHQECGDTCGPIVRIEVPAPVKARKAGGK